MNRLAFLLLALAAVATPIVLFARLGAQLARPSCFFYATRRRFHIRFTVESYRTFLRC